MPWGRSGACGRSPGAHLLIALVIACSSQWGAALAAEDPPSPSSPASPQGDGDGARPWRRCGLEASLGVDFEGNKAPYRVEWRRCGPKEASWQPDGSGVDYPVHYLVVRRDAHSRKPVMVIDNSDEPGLSYIGRVQPMDFTKDGKEQLMVVRYLYGTGAGWEMCVLGWVGDRLRCWETPDYGAAVDGMLRGDEACWKTVLRSVDDSRLLVEALIYDRDKDPNCCPSRGSVFVELLPARGRLDVGKVWRLAPGATD